MSKVRYVFIWRGLLTCFCSRINRDGLLLPSCGCRWDGKTAPDWIGNYKIIQRVFDAKKVDKYIGP
jgi:hypothetical protein